MDKHTYKLSELLAALPYAQAVELKKKLSTLWKVSKDTVNRWCKEPIGNRTAMQLNILSAAIDRQIPEQIDEFNAVEPSIEE